MTATAADSRTAQRWDPGRYDRNARFVADLGEPVVDLLAPRPGERILDLGCGHGVLTRKLADLGCRVTAVDASAEQVAAARDLGLDARVMDGQALDFEAAFDAVFSNAALHWMSADPDAVIAGVARALRPGGRFVGEMGGAGNVARISAALVDAFDRRGLDGRDAFPWFFPAAEDYARRLGRAGFAVRSMELIPRPTTLPGDIAGWLETFAESWLLRLPEAGRSAFVDEVRTALEPHLRGDDGIWRADYVRLRFAADLPA
ncbi:MAG: methyltransferase domain-containing protein [Hyphomicrobiales bacterium]|nr:methyltransferase domain-containing protein [Hyphomicrobiales bacterium]